MPYLTEAEKKYYKQSYEQHKSLIESRQENERHSPEPELKKYPTNLNFPNADGFRLLHLAILAGEPKEVIENLIEKGANPNLPKVDRTNSPLMLALRYEQFEIFDELLKHCNITLLFRDSLDTPKAQEKYDKLIREQVLNSALQSKSSPTGMIQAEVLPKKHPRDLSSRHYINYAAEIGDIDFIKKYYSKSFFSFQEEPINPLQSAIKSNQLEALKEMIRYQAIDKKNQKHWSALHSAAQLSNWSAAKILLEHNLSAAKFIVIVSDDGKDVIKEWLSKAKVGDILLLKNKAKNLWTLMRSDGISISQEPIDLKTYPELDNFIFLEEENRAKAYKEILAGKSFLNGYLADVNKRNKSDETPLFIALKNGNTEFALELINHGADVNVITATRETLWHALACCPELERDKVAKWLNPDQKDLNNIYGQSPKDYAESTESLSQGKIIEKIIFYHHLNYREPEFISEEGYCNGFVFLYQYFHSINKLDIFYGILQAIVDWDGTELSLASPVPENLDKVFHSLGELFDTTINWLTWYQHNSIIEAETKLQQGDRLLQTEVGMSYIFSQLVYTDVSATQLNELHQILSALPQPSRIESGGAGHIVGFNVTENRNAKAAFNYYDSNFKAALSVQPTPEQMTEILLKTKYSQLSGRESADVLKISAYYFTSDKIDFSKYRYYDNSSPTRTLPVDPKTYELMTKGSANGYTPLHIAALTHSVQDIKMLLKLDISNINQKDKHGMSAFDIAIKSNDLELLQLFLDDPRLLIESSEALVDCYRYPVSGVSPKIIELILQYPKAKNLNDLFNAARLNNDSQLMQRLIELGKVSNEFLWQQYLTPTVDIWLFKFEKSMQDKLKEWGQAPERKDEDRLYIKADEIWIEVSINEQKFSINDNIEEKLTICLEIMMKAKQQTESSHQLEKIWKEHSGLPDPIVNIVKHSENYNQKAIPENIMQLAITSYDNADFNLIANALIKNCQFDLLLIHCNENAPLTEQQSQQLLLALLEYPKVNLNGKTTYEILTRNTGYQCKELPLLLEKQWQRLLKVICRDESLEVNILNKSLNLEPEKAHSLERINLFMELLGAIMQTSKSLELSEALMIHFHEIINETIPESEQPVLAILADQYRQLAGNEKEQFFNLIKLCLENGAQTDFIYDKNRTFKEWAIENNDNIRNLISNYQPRIQL